MINHTFWGSPMTVETPICWPRHVNLTTCATLKKARKESSPPLGFGVRIQVFFSRLVDLRMLFFGAFGCDGLEDDSRRTNAVCKCYLDDLRWALTDALKMVSTWGRRVPKDPVVKFSAFKTMCQLSNFHLSGIVYPTLPRWNMVAMWNH